MTKRNLNCLWNFPPKRLLRYLLPFILFMAIGVASANSTCSGITEGLVACYPFDGNANDASGNGNHGMSQSGVSFVAGKIGKAAKFDGGINGYIRIPHNATQKFNDQFSVAGWILSNGRGGIIFTKYSWAAAGGGGKGFSISGSDDLTYALTNSAISIASLFNTSGGHEYRPVYKIPSYIFQYFVVTYNQGKAKIYISGELKVEKDMPHLGTLENNYDMLIGAFFTNDGTTVYSSINGRSFDGLLDDLRIYNRALSDSEIKTLYNLTCTDTEDDACENETAGCKHANYSVKERTLTIPFIELPVIDGLNNQPTGEVEMWQGALRLKYNTVDRFRLLSKQFAPITDDSNSTCPATYSFDTGILSIPYIDVPTVVAVGKAKFDSESKIEVFKAIMKWAPQENMFVVQEIEKQP
jgi:hypothetical protein